MTFMFNGVSERDGFDKVVKILQDALKNASVFVSPPDFLEFGAEGFWKTCGSYVVWQKGQAGFATVEDIKRDAPQLLAPFSRAIMMELAWSDPMPMWLGIPITIKKDGLHQFSMDKYNKLCKIII